jgi:oligoendopeptidase F
MTMKMTPHISDDQRWDLTAIFPGLNSAEYESYVREYESGIEAFSAAVATLGALAKGGIPDWIKRILDLEKLELAEQQLSGYVACVRAEQPGNSAVTKAGIHLQRLYGRLKSGKAALLQKLAPLSDQQFARLAAAPELASGGYRIELLRHDSKIALSERDEMLIAELNADGRDRWARVAAETLAQTTLVLKLPSGASEKRPMSERYELASSPDPQIRRATFDALNAAFAPRASLMANCLNAMAGTGIALARRRGLDPIEESLSDNWIKRETVETMQAALRANAPVLQDYLRLKAKRLGLPTIGIYDRYASLDVAELNFADVHDAESRIIDAFEEFCPAIADYTRDAIAGRWIETEMRAGKQLGGFCASLPETRETRIFMSFAGSFNASAMLAHELGHGYHAHVNFPRRFWNQNAPSSLSETASILCEHFLRRSIFQSNAFAKRVRLGALAAQLDSAVNYLLRLPRDFEFEVAFYRERANGEVSADRLCELMRAAHASWFGSALAGDDGDALSWSYNHIMMVPDYRIYNFPYSFGYLLSSRIADAFAEQGKSFTPTYDAFLHATSTLPLEEAVSSTLGFDVTTADFWDKSLVSVADQLRLFSELAS